MNCYGGPSPRRSELSRLDQLPPSQHVAPCPHPAIRREVYLLASEITCEAWPERRGGYGSAPVPARLAPCLPTQKGELLANARTRQVNMALRSGQCAPGILPSNPDLGQKAFLRITVEDDFAILLRDFPVERLRKQHCDIPAARLLNPYLVFN